MVIQFKNKQLEIQLEAKASHLGDRSASQVASLDLERYYYLIANESPIDLTRHEFQALCRLVQAGPYLFGVNMVKRLPLLLDDIAHNLTSFDNVDTEQLCSKLKQASLLQLFATLDRVERSIKQSPLNQLKGKKSNGL